MDIKHDIDWKVYPLAELKQALETKEVDAISVIDPTGELLVSEGFAKDIVNSNTVPLTRMNIAVYSAAEPWVPRRFRFLVQVQTKVTSAYCEEIRELIRRMKRGTPVSRSKALIDEEPASRRR
jgi:ABC-type nitrate/sulfonate/bicarbonate transport system substrate-binding protein